MHLYIINQNNSIVSGSPILASLYINVNCKPRAQLDNNDNNNNNNKVIPVSNLGAISRLAGSPERYKAD